MTRSTARSSCPSPPRRRASGIAAKGYFERCWYRRAFTRPPLGAGERLILYFEAADYHATVFVDDQAWARTRGGYTRFGFDITDQVANGDTHTLTVRCDDDPYDLAKPAASRTGCPSRTASGTHGRPACGKRSGPKSCGRRTSRASGGRPTWPRGL